ncbi:hypothetical protein KORDIASMS9_04536 [Kordia sp. SMS9]|nr:hypothetical protein KORDIASMS9_04536 [Kordia sp. SMS9]
MKLKHVVSKIVLIALYCFLLKTILEVCIEWSQIFPLQVYAHTWGNFRSSVSYILLDFTFYFWIYVLVTGCYYMIINNVKKINSWTGYLLATIFSIVILLFLHNFQFPTRQYYFPSSTGINYKLIEEFIVYTCATYLMIFTVHKSQKSP